MKEKQKRERERERERETRVKGVEGWEVKRKILKRKKEKETESGGSWKKK